ncbi:LysR family transcriptional regulator [Saccharopolyspora rectivirgula]|jgi:DNA-binding transcriptional LysR family regulator|uniref:LysR family transcriptional regulator n=1 Tax=Saccharopolyspora rectivirgula TaxID=28042 RepID=UPI0009DE4606|nr:LysR family transcriptional regulator [Saccharopolyspora rectivirgula]
MSAEDARRAGPRFPQERSWQLRLVEYFVAVMEHGSVTKAAQALFIAQPSLSQAIRNLERQLGVQLFHRTGRKLVLTEDGKAFAEPARRILRDVQRAREAVQQVRATAAGQLDLAVVPALAVHPLPLIAGEFRRQHPGVLLNVMDPGGAAATAEEVRRGNAELGLTELPATSGSLRSKPLYQQEVVLVAPPSLAARLPDPVPLAAVADIPLVMETSETSVRPLLHEDLAATARTVAVECAHRQAIWHLVMNGAGATFLPRELAAQELPEAVRLSTVPPIHRSVGVVHRPGPLSPAAAAFLTVAETVVPVEAPPGKPVQPGTADPASTPGRTAE